MKLKPFFKYSAVSVFSVVAILGVLTSTAVQAQDSSEQIEQLSSAGITIEVPQGAEPVKYMVGDEEFEVLPGTSMQIPASASDIQLSAGTVLTAVRQFPSGGKKVVKLTVLDGFTFPSFGIRDVRRTLNANSENIGEIDVYRELPNGDIMRNPEDLKVVRELVQIANLIQQNAVDAATLSEVGGTDQN